jgi:pimeloyl-[acyl-carrier protein] methyl ester esterase
MPTSAVMTGLWTESQGTGPELVLLHGWGLHGGIWDELAPALIDAHRAIRPDLPGHGRSPPVSASAGPALARWAEAVLAAAPARADWLGWSLGGLIALWAAAHHPERVRRLVLLASTPRFVRGPDWPDAVDPQVFDDFAAALGQAYRPTLLRFVALQTRAGGHARDDQRQLRARLFERGEPDPAALAEGLTILRGSDLRAQLSRVTQPALVITGGRDTLIPAGASRRLARALPAGRLLELADAGHAPFLSHGAELAARIRAFLSR